MSFLLPADYPLCGLSGGNYRTVHIKVCMMRYSPMRLTHTINHAALFHFVRQGTEKEKKNMLQLLIYIILGF